MRRHHSKSFKQSLVKKICLPGGPTIMQSSKELNIHHVTIRNWMKIYANISSMNDSNNWTPERKLEAIIKTASMNENEIGEFLRSNGLHSKVIDEWKQDIYSSQRPVGRPRLDPELVELRSKEKELARDLRRKDKALAEMSARIILLKKSNLFFGGTEDDE